MQSRLFPQPPQRQVQCCYSASSVSSSTASSKLISVQLAQPVENGLLYHTGETFELPSHTSHRCSQTKSNFAKERVHFSTPESCSSQSPVPSDSSLQPPLFSSLTSDISSPGHQVADGCGETNCSSHVSGSVEIETSCALDDLPPSAVTFPSVDNLELVNDCPTVLPPVTRSPVYSSKVMKCGLTSEPVKHDSWLTSGQISTSISTSHVPLEAATEDAFEKVLLSSWNNTGRDARVPDAVHLSSDERFKYTCPYPHCGRHYQAERSLLRHLSRYHRDSVNYPSETRHTRTRSIYRRSASEERPVTQCFNRSLCHPNETVIEIGSRCPLVYKGSICRNISIDLPNTLDRFSAGVSCSGEEHDPRNRISPQPVESRHRVGPGQAYDLAAHGNSPPHSGNEPTGVSGEVTAAHQILPLFLNSDHLSYTKPMVDCISPVRLSVPDTQIRQSRVRSASGFSEDRPNRVISPIGSRRPYMSTSMSVSSSYTGMFTSPNSGACAADSENRPDSGRRRTVSTGAQPVGSSSPNDLAVENSTNRSTCPSCGFGLAESELKRREWMSGIHALTYSKTDSICCPIDGCVRVCHGRADLSAHLTSSHFPEVKNQLVRLIFACPVKDCHMVCSDEKNFQAHFNRHLFGYLPGDLTELFPLSFVPSCLTDESKSRFSDDASPVKANATVHEPPSQLQIENLSDPALLKCQPNDSPLSTSKILSTLAEDSLVPQLVTFGNCVPDIDCVQQLRPQHHALLHSMSSSMPNVLVSTDPSSFVECTEVARQCAPIQEPPNHVQPISTDTILEAPRNRTKSGELSDLGLVSTPATPVDTAHMDLTDHRNLLSALDLIPDDLLMELLKEDRPGLWGGGCVNNPPNYSAPHVYESSDFTPPDFSFHNSGEPTGCFNSALAHECMYIGSLEDHPDPAHVTDEHFTSMQSHSYEPYRSSGHTLSDAHSPAPSFTSWVPSPVVHQTWSLAVANERSVDSTSPGESADYAHDCPLHVLSDLTAALILPDVERRLKASISAKRWTNVATAPATTPRSNYSDTSGSAVQHDSQTVRHTYCSQKRRRNASESSTNALPCGSSPSKFQSVQFSVSTPSKSMKHLHSDVDCDYRRDDLVRADENSLDLSQEPVFDKEGLQSDSVAPSSELSSCSAVLSDSHHASASCDAECLLGRNAQLFHAEYLSSHLVDATTCLSPKRMEQEPRKRQRGLIKVMRVTSESLPVCPLSHNVSDHPISMSMTSLPRVHSIVRCSVLHSPR
ncbi:unnamed protein product [Dicrocoelium dendriticum]|nr:unnamed protein product [Dicrocoelium dendriticum]